MEYALLRSLRVLGPGLILLSYFDLFRVLVFQMSSFFWGLDASKIILIAYIVGGIFGAALSVSKKERVAFRGVHSALLVALDEVCPGAGKCAWTDIAPEFYKIIDNDKSLSIKGQGIYFNGLVVTTSFDSALISIAAIWIGLEVLVCRHDGAFLFASTSIALLSFIIWRISIKRHYSLGLAQVNVIKCRFSDEFSTYISVLKSKTAKAAP